MNRTEKTLDFHKNCGFTCSQSIIAAFGEQYGIDQDQARLLGRTLAGGIGGQGQTCGYIAGALLILAHEYNDKDEAQARENTHPAVMELIRRFKEKYGTTNCNDLLGIDRTTEKGLKILKEENLPAKHCYCEGGFGQHVAEILESLI